MSALARAIRAAAREAEQRRLVFRRVAVTAAAAALLTMGLAFWPVRMRIGPTVARMHALFGASPNAGRDGEFTPSSATGPMRLAFGSPIAIEPARFSLLNLSNGVEMMVEPESSLTLPDSRNAASGREELVLAVGSILVQVPKLPRGHVITIRTPDTVVSVHGAAFSVDVTKAGPFDSPRTRIAVTGGSASVRYSNREVLLEAGTEWISPREASRSPAGSTASP